MFAKLGLWLAVAALAAGPAPETTFQRPVYVTNIVSSDVSAFTIQPGGALRLGDRVPAGESPRGIVVAPNGRTAYAANGDSSTISTYRIGSGGALTLLPPATATDEDPDDAVVAPGGHRLYVINRTAETISTFPIAADGTLVTPRTTTQVGGENPRGIAMTPDGRFLYVGTGDPLDTTPDWVIRFAVRGDGTLTRLGRTRIGAAGGAMAVSPDGRFLYVPCSASHEVFGFRIGPGGDLTPVAGSPSFAPDVPIAAAMTPDGRHLYVTDGGLIGSGSHRVSAFDVRADGSLTRLADFTAGASPVGVAATPDGRHLYVSNLDSDDVSAFTIEPTGRLREVAGSPFRTGGEQPAFQSIAIVPNQGPTASFSAHDASFDASSSSDPDGRVARYDWDFGDGTRLPDGGPRPAHDYARPGTYKVTLMVTDDENCSADLVFTGTIALCNGSSGARAELTITVGA